MTKNEEVGYADKRYDYSDIWMLLIRRSSLAYAEGKFGEFYRTVETLHRKLYKKDRDIINKWIATNKPNPEEINVDIRKDYYSRLELEIVTLLEERGYIKTTIKERRIGNDEITRKD